MQYSIYHVYFAFACVDKGPYCQESYLILLINRRHVATYV